jgi:hypothetical protein
VTFLALGAADILHRYAVLRAVLQVLVEMLINAVELITAITRGIREVHLGRTVTVDTPAHTKWSELVYLIHLLDRPMTGLALYLTGLGMLGVVKIDVVGEIMDLDPFNRLGILGMISARFGIVTGIAV